MHIYVSPGSVVDPFFFCVIAVSSFIYQVESIDALTETGNIRETFVGLILLPIVGNAAEHATAVTVACKDKMDLTIGVAVGSSMQIALLVLPLIVVLGWIIGVEDMVWMSPMQTTMWIEGWY